MPADRPMTTEERFLADLRSLRMDPGGHEPTPMLARFRRKRDSGGIAATDFSTGTIIKITEAVRVFLWPTDAAPGDRPALIAHMRCEPEQGWEDLAQPTPVMVRGRLEKGAAIIADTEGCTFTSLHPASIRWWRAPRLDG